MTVDWSQEWIRWALEFLRLMTKKPLLCPVCPVSLATSSRCKGLSSRSERATKKTGLEDESQSLSRKLCDNLPNYPANRDRVCSSQGLIRGWRLSSQELHRSLWRKFQWMRLQIWWGAPGPIRINREALFLVRITITKLCPICAVISKTNTDKEIRILKSSTKKVTIF